MVQSSTHDLKVIPGIEIDCNYQVLTFIYWDIRSNGKAMISRVGGEINGRFMKAFPEMIREPRKLGIKQTRRSAEAIRRKTSTAGRCRSSFI
jgi:hypothetical protein